MGYNVDGVMPMTTGEKIKSARQNAKLTQKKLSELTGIAEPTIRKYESNRLNPKKETLQKIAFPLGVDYLDLYGDEDSQEVAAHMKEGLRLGLSAKEGITRAQFMSEFQEQGYSFEPGETRLVHAYNRLNDTGQAQILLLTESMAEIPRFMLDPPEDGAQPPQDTPTAPSEGKTEKPPEGPQEGK